MYSVDSFFIYNISESSCNEVKDVIKSYVVSFMKLKVKNIFLITSLYFQLRHFGKI